MCKALRVSREILAIILTVSRDKVFSENNIHCVSRETDTKTGFITYHFKYVYLSGEFEKVDISQTKLPGTYRVTCDARNYDGKTYWDVVTEPYAYIKGGF